jgi:hypothetical protein
MDIKPHFLSDSPITDGRQDRLRRGTFVNALYREIKFLPYEDSFCFGLYASWGEGKTSILNLLKNKLLESCVEFGNMHHSLEFPKHLERKIHYN